MHAVRVHVIFADNGEGHTVYVVKLFSLYLIKIRMNGNSKRERMPFRLNDYLYWYTRRLLGPFPFTT